MSMLERPLLTTCQLADAPHTSAAAKKANETAMVFCLWDFPRRVAFQILMAVMAANLMAKSVKINGI
jgi:hypothetical protein